MNSLKVKILGLISAILILAIGTMAWQNLKTQKAMILQVAAQNSRILGQTIRNSIINTMATGQNTEVANILKKIQNEPAIATVRIFDETGRILRSADPSETGDLVSAADLLAYRNGKTSFTNESRGEELFCALVPIHNAPDCFNCHDSRTETLGVLNVHLSMDELAALQQRGRETALFSSMGVIAILILSITGFILFYVDKPVRKLVAAMNQVEQGNFEDARTHVESSSEMALLSGKFNTMVDRLKNLIETTIRHEREIAVTQEKLSHHDEIRNMNLTLEERLKEIEYLNITLEERIEEIEEANYKIADLASDLEDKNKNLEDAVSRLSALYNMGLALNSTMDLNKLFDQLLQRTAETVQARLGYILLLTDDGQSLEFTAGVGLPDSVASGTRIPLKPGGVSHWVISNRQPRLIRSMEEARDLSRVSRLGFTRETVVCAPLTDQEEVIGTITMANRQDDSPFSAEDLELLSTIAAQASVAIRNARLYESQQNSYLQTVQALVSAIEASDAYTSGHSERVTRYSLALARRMDLSGEAMKRLEQAATLHDIGKIGIDISLLHKEGQLSSDDIEILRQHPTIGVKILEPICFLEDVLPVIEQHHEQFDGNGYPKGLAGEELCIEARILAVVDTYDAMTSDRPYRRALPHDTAVQEIQDFAGIQFDPEVVEAFIGLCEQEGLRKLTENRTHAHIDAILHTRSASS